MKIKLLLMLLSFSFASNYQFVSTSGSKSTLNFTSSQLNISEEDGFSRFLSGDGSSTTEEGLPALHAGKDQEATASAI